MHDIFLQKICSVDYFFSSDVVQLFLKGPVDFIKQVKAYKIPTYQKIAENFESNFKDGLDYDIHQESIPKLLELKGKYLNAIGSLNKFEHTCFENSRSIKEYKNATINILADIQGTYKWLNPDRSENQITFEELEPYEKLLNWIIEQIQDFSAVIEAISKVEELMKVKEITEHSIQAGNVEIQKLALGKRSLIAIINNKSKDDLLKIKKDYVDDLTAQLKAIEIIIPVVSSKLLNIEIPNIENRNLATFDKEIRVFAELSIKDFEGIRRQLLLSE